MDEPELTAFESGLLRNFSRGELNTELKSWFEEILIHKYIDNEWDEDDKELAGSLIESDKKLYTKYRTYLSVSDVLTNNEKQSTGNNSGQTDNEITAVKNNNTGTVSFFKRIITKPMSIAAMIIILAGIGSVLYFTSGKYSDEKIYSSFYTPYEMDFSISRDNPQELLTAAQTAYLNGNFVKASGILQTVAKKDSTDMQMYMNLGALMMLQEKYKDATGYFQFVIDHNNFIMRDIAEWYLAFCYLKTGEREKAKTIFTNLAKNKGVMQDKAEKLLKKMK
jgi:tetratricopeptide (TPR) repeat protein